VGGFGEALDGHRLRGDEQCPIGPDTGNGPEQGNSGDSLSHALDPFIESPDHRGELGDEGPLHSDEQALLGSQPWPGLGAYPLLAVLGEKVTPGQVEPDVVELGVNAGGSGGSHADQFGTIAQQNGLLALLDGFGMNLGDETSEAHTGQELGIEIVPLVGRVGDGPEPLGMGEDEIDAGSLKQFEEPWPGWAGFDHDLHGTIPIQ